MQNYDYLCAVFLETRHIDCSIICRICTSKEKKSIYIHIGVCALGADFTIVDIGSAEPDR